MCRASRTPSLTSDRPIAGVSNTAAATDPPAPRIETAADCAEPANAVADCTVAAAGPIPAARANDPKATPKPATASGAAARVPSRSDARCSLPDRSSRIGPMCVCVIVLMWPRSRMLVLC
jgi:hypothetical protein